MALVNIHMDVDRSDRFVCIALATIALWVAARFPHAVASARCGTHPTDAAFIVLYLVAYATVLLGDAIGTHVIPSEILATTIVFALHAAFVVTAGGTLLRCPFLVRGRPAMVALAAMVGIQAMLFVAVGIAFALR